MNLQTCPNGHFYDAEKFSSCPHCQNVDPMAMNNPTQPMEMQLDKTVALVGNPAGDGRVVIPDNNAGYAPQTDNFDPAGVTMPMGQEPVIAPQQNVQIPNPPAAEPAPAQDDTYDTGDKTVRYFEAVSTEPVTGWLVCIEGEKNLGKDFKLKVGRNFIGRSEQDVRLEGDPSVSRRKHAVVLYEPKNNIFIMEPGESRELSYLNDNVVLSPVEIKSNDIIQVGNTKLMFIPCCTDKFKWDDVIPEEEK
ncbi:MAG: FHA domain-containing protein [Eubacterium sp.]|nr:FHA domain-containing protein [Eubacterium sp.]